MPEQLGKILIVAGIMLIVIGVFFLSSKFLPIGRLPGDITVKNGNFTFYFPIVTCLVISIVMTIIFFFAGKR
jgi:hypothetical protein